MSITPYHTYRKSDWVTDSPSRSRKPAAVFNGKFTRFVANREKKAFFLKINFNYNSRIYFENMLHHNNIIFHIWYLNDVYHKQLEDQKMIAASMIFSIRCCSSLFVSACRHNFIVLQPFMAKAALQQSFFGCSQLQQQPFCVCRHSYIVLQPSILKAAVLWAAAAAICVCSSSLYGSTNTSI